MATRLNISMESPGVQVNERDISQNTINAIGTNVFFAGFTPQGPTDEPIFVSSLSEWEEIFGLPTTPAEKYSYNAAKQLLTTSNASVTFTRMPYGSGAGIGFSDQYSAMIFPIVGVSAVEVNVCDYYRNVDENNCKVNFPWLYTNYFVNSSVCYGTSNLTCSLNSQDETPGYLYIIDDPVQYNSIFTGFKFVVDADTDAEDLRIYQLRPTSSGLTTTYDVVTSINLSSVFVSKDENTANLSNDAKRLIVDLTNTVFASPYNITSGLMSGSTINGIPVSAGDVFATYSESGSPVLKFFYADPSVALSYKTHITASVLSAGDTFSVTTTAKNATNIDTLIEFCTIPVEAGLSCQTITSLGLTVPEKDKYNFYPVNGAADLNDANFYVLGEPIVKKLNATEYNLLMEEQFTWKCGAFANVEPALDVVNNDVRAGLIVVNELKTSQLEDFTGYYLAVNDNLNVNPSTDFDGLTGVNGYYQETCPGVSGNWVNVPSERYNFNVSSVFNGTAGSISEIVEQNAGWDFGKTLYNDSLILSLFKLRPTRLTDTINKLDQVLVEKFVGSLNESRKINDEFGGPPRSMFLENTVNDQSNYLKVLVNPYLSQNNCWNDSTGTPQKTVRMFRTKTASVFDNFSTEQTLRAYADNLYGIGTYTGHCVDELYTLCQKKDIGNLPAKLERALRNVENPQEYNIDITIDAGLSTIWATRQAVSTDSCITSPSICYHFDDTYFVDTESLSPFDGTSMNSDIGDAWQVITNTFDSFARYTRKAAGGIPHLHIVDPLRQIFVNGKDYKVVKRQKQYLIDPVTGQPTEKYSTFSRNIWSYLRNLYSGINSSYSATYGNWIKDYDTHTDSYCWFGPSAFVAALLARNDNSQFPWTAPLGYSNGVLSNVIDLAINPNQRERDLLSRINVNPIVKFADGGGNLLWNTLTLQKEDSALREIYIRRGLIWLANGIQATLRQFIGQPNTVVTRTRAKNSLRPLLEFMKDNAGLYGYEVVCDERNNTPDTIDKYQLNVAVYVQPVRTIKFVLVDLVITRTGIDFAELI